VIDSVGLCFIVIYLFLWFFRCVRWEHKMYLGCQKRRSSGIGSFWQRGYICM